MTYSFDFHLPSSVVFGTCEQIFRTQDRLQETRLVTQTQHKEPNLSHIISIWNQNYHLLLFLFHLILAITLNWETKPSTWEFVIQAIKSSIWDLVFVSITMSHLSDLLLERPVSHFLLKVSDLWKILFDFLIGRERLISWPKDRVWSLTEDCFCLTGHFRPLDRKIVYALFIWRHCWIPAIAHYKFTCFYKSGWRCVLVCFNDQFYSVLNCCIISLFESLVIVFHRFTLRWF